MKIPQATAASNGRDADLEVERRVGLCPQRDRSNNPQMEF